MIFPNVPCLVIPFAGATDIYGQRQFGAPRREKVVVIKLIDIETHSTVRADQSATKGSAQEENALATLLFPAASKIKVDDRVQVNGMDLLVRQKSPRYDTEGEISHYTVGLELWR